MRAILGQANASVVFWVLCTIESWIFGLETNPIENISICLTKGGTELNKFLKKLTFQVGHSSAEFDYFCVLSVAIR